MSPESHIKCIFNLIRTAKLFSQMVYHFMVSSAMHVSFSSCTYFPALSIVDV